MQSTQLAAQNQIQTAASAPESQLTAEQQEGCFDNYVCVIIDQPSGCDGFTAGDASSTAGRLKQKLPADSQLGVRVEVRVRVRVRVGWKQLTAKQQKEEIHAALVQVAGQPAVLRAEQALGVRPHLKSNRSTFFNLNLQMELRMNSTYCFKHKHTNLSCFSSD